MIPGLPRPDYSRSVTSDRIDIGGLSLAYRRAGSGPPLVLLHGAVCDGRVWTRQLQELSDEFTVVAWDAPGCGLSSDPPETFRLADYADCLAAFIADLGLSRPHVLGHSFGGGLALELYGRHPTVPRTLILAGAYAGWAGSLFPEEVERRLQAALEMAARGPGGLDADSMPGLLSENAPVEVSTELAGIMSEFHPAGTRVMAVAFAAADLRYVLPLVQVPTLLLYGEADRRAPIQVAQGIHQGIRSSELVMLPGSGHDSYLEVPEEFGAHVRRFLRSAPAD